jgi:esterase
LKRQFFLARDGARLSYLEFGNPAAQTLVALHGHFGSATTFADLASGLPDWRVISLDQRGHGWSAHVEPEAYTTDRYLEDVHLLIEQELGGISVVLLGHSLGGAIAYQFAARWPELVRALIVEDIGAEIGGDQSWLRRLPQRVSTLRRLQESLESLLGAGAFRYFGESAVELPDGWTFRFDTVGLIRSQELLNGSWWKEWLGSSCPALLMQGERSEVLSAEHAKDMADRRPNTILRRFAGCGHTIRMGDPLGYLAACKEFLEKL